MQRFRCKHQEKKADGTEERCPEQVCYEEGINVFRMRRAGSGLRKKTVYLECDTGHICKYEVEVSKE